MARHTPEWWCSTADVKADLGELALRSGRAASVNQALKAMIDLGATLVLARLVAPSDFGLVGMVAVLTGFVALFSDLGLATVTVQREDLEPSDVSSLFWLNTSLGIVLCVFTVALSPLVSLYYRTPSLTPIACALALSFALTGVTVQHRALLRRRMLNARLAVVELVQMLVGAVAAVWLATRGFGVWAIALRSPIAAATGVVVTFIACDFLPRASLESRKLKLLFGSGARLTGFTLVNYVARNFDNLLIGRYAGAHALGLYSKAYDLLMLPIRQISDPATSVAIPSLSRVVDNPDRYRNAFLRILEKVLLLSLTLGAFLMASSDAIIELVLGARWSGASSIFFWLGWLTFSQPLGNAMGWLFVSQGRTSELLRWGVLGSSLSVASFVIGLRWGPVGVAMAYALSGIGVRAPIVVWMACRNGPVRIGHVLRTALPLVGAALLSLAMGLMARRLVGTILPILTLLMTAGVCAGTMLLVLLPFAAGRRALSDLVMIADFRRRFSA
jgi:O-antigen/teichoic acid export membrane protein